MGSNFAHDLASGDLVQSLEQQISIHFSSNCYPPIPQFMVALGVEAIQAVNESDYTRELTLPDGVQFRNSLTVSALDAVNALRLDAWIDEGAY